ncbi:glycoside hydrolase superfamily [Dendryphion nanum]|uniref:Alpha-amylase n=1 Tax=Dendryphion nanum TaxID=256645 RepID=A0A9P9EEY0_9PLEO|nr:glycoside hydrolase superfamily [Dendryphion nanum]
MLFIHTVFTGFLSLCSFAAAADTSAWKLRSIYFVLTDRIARSSSDTGGSSCVDLGRYCGGTFKGLESKLDYIKELGFDAIWITPVVKNSANGYHGYWAQDLYAVNSNYGTAADLKSFVNAAHEKGVYVMVDVVANHMGPGPIADNRPAPLNKSSSYHADCNINYDDQSTVEQCRIANLPDINTSNPEIRNTLNTWIKWLVNEYRFDGIRIDTVKHVEKGFWPGFVKAADVYSIGEVWDGNAKYLAGYSSNMPGLLNYAVYFPMNRFYQQKGSSKELADMIDTVSSSFPDPAALGTFLDNHDNPRWLNQKNDHTLLKNALAFVILSRGIPILYYGTEQGYTGGADPANREDLWRSNFDTSSPLYRAITKLTAARKALGGLPGNDHVTLYTASDAYAWSRADGKLVVLTTNGGGSSSGNHCFNAKKPYMKWTNAYGDGATLTADSSGNICLEVVNGEPVVLVASTSSSTLAPAQSVAPTNSAFVTEYGDTIRIAGNNTQLGNWNPASAPALLASEYTTSHPVWTVTLSMGPGQIVAYKFIKVSSAGAITWESDANRHVSVPRCEARLIVSNEWQ